MTAGGGGVVSRVDPDSPSDRAGIVAGDRIEAVDGQRVRDLIDWHWHTSESSALLSVASPDGRVRDVEIERGAEPWGIEFASVLFDPIRTCTNACEFCFVTQLPPGLRPDLYVRDDDFRLSFLTGNFISLTNLTDADVERILEQRLSPLYVSLHAVDPEVRRRLIRCSSGDDAVARLDELLGHGIHAHVQIVLVPGVNDGAVLERTLDWIEERDGILSAGVVPLGYTAHQDRYTQSFAEEAAGSVLDTIERRRARRSASGAQRLVHAADEFYLVAGRPLPAADAYEGYPQYENGIGLVRAFLDEWDEVSPHHGALAAQPEPAPGENVLLTGTLFAPVLSAVVASMAFGSPVRVLATENRFFGGGVSVTGLLTGSDLATTIRDDVTNGALAVTYIAPDIVLNEDGLTLDGMTPEDVSEHAGAPVTFGPTGAGGLLALLTSTHT